MYFICFAPLSFWRVVLDSLKRYNVSSVTYFTVPAAGANAIVAVTDDEAESKACKEIAKAGTHFVWTQLRSLGTFLGTREAQKQKQQRTQSLLQQEVPQEQPEVPQEEQGVLQEKQAQSQSQPTAATTGEAGHSVAAEPMDTDTPGHQSSHDSPHGTAKAPGPGAVNGVNGNTSCDRQPNYNTGGNVSMHGTPHGLGSPEKQATVKKEEAASTTEEHTESHKYVKTERDASGRQQTAAELVQKKTTTQVHKRKREKASASGGTDTEVDGGRSNPETMAAPPLRSDASEQEKTADQHSAGALDCMQSCRTAGRLV